MKNPKSVFLILILSLFISNSFALDDNKLTALSKQIMEAKSGDALYAPFAELKESYFKENKYSEFAEFLKSLSQKKEALGPFVNYYIALARYQQLKYLEETQSWEEYFNQGNSYRDEITTAAQKAIDATTTKDALNILSRLVLWQFHQDQQDDSGQAALTDLMSACATFAKETSDAKLIKEVADKLTSYEEKGKAKELYKIYVEKIAAGEIKDDTLANIAANFYKEGNLDLAESVYDLYAERITKSLPKEKALPILVEIARSFSYKDRGQNDPIYAEKIFEKIEELGAKDGLNEELIYLRAFNLEKAREYEKAKGVYISLTSKFPLTVHSDEALYKVGMINTYILRDIKNGRAFFDKLTAGETVSPQIISALYQLGLLAQWQEDLAGAKGYYDQLIRKAGENFPETVSLTRMRLKEIEEKKPIENNLKTFLDASLKEEYTSLAINKAGLKCNPYQAKKGESVNIKTEAPAAESGCFSVALEYLWSGDTGSARPGSQETAFSATFSDPGTKEINLVILSPSGIAERSLDFLDVN